MIDVENESIITLAEAARSVPGGAVHVSTVHRWRMKGCRGVRLETILRGGVRFTSREALARFFQQSTAVADGDAVGATHITRQPEVSISSAEKRLEAAGI